MGQIAIGISKGFDAREVARNAAQQALSKLGTGRPSFAISFVSREFNASQAVAGLISMLGNTPLWGMSTYYPLTVEGEQSRSVVVIIVSGKNFEADAQILNKNDLEVENQEPLMKNFSIHSPSALLLAGDGMKGVSESTLRKLKQSNVPFYGCLGSGDFLQDQTVQFAGGKCEAGGLSILALGGSFKVGTGLGHGWQEIGFVYQIGRIEDRIIRELEGVTPAKIYENIFGYPAEEWSSPAFNDVIPLYPLGIEIFPGSTDLFLRTPLRVETDGSFVLNTPAPEGQMAHVMVGDIQLCLDAVKQAVETAKKGLQDAHPLAAIVLVDYAWRLLFGERIKEIFEIIQQSENDIPVLGAYTLGHILNIETSILPQVANQNVMVLLIGEKS
jgi:hypothetical protein